MKKLLLLSVFLMLGIGFTKAQTKPPSDLQTIDLLSEGLQTNDENKIEVSSLIGNEVYSYSLDVQEVGSSESMEVPAAQCTAWTAVSATKECRQCFFGSPIVTAVTECRTISTPTVSTE